MKNQTVFITGASAGFGAATARLFAEKGARLILLARRKERLVALQNELKEKFQSEIYVIEADVAQEDQIASSIKLLQNAFGLPTILINNAGMVRGTQKLWEVTSDQWNEMIDTNVKGLLNVTRQILPHMRENNAGHIINVGSISGHDTYPGGGVYCATKFAVRALTDTLRMELVDSPIRVSLISPGMAETEFSLVRFSGDQKKADQVYQGITPLSSEDIAEAIFFIASRPPHVNIADLIMYPTNQATPSLIHRKIK